MTNMLNIGKWFYAIAFAVFGVQHFIYASFVKTLVPAWLPWHLFFNYLVAVAFIAVALSIIINKYVQLSCTLLAILLLLFLLLIHVPNLISQANDTQRWARAVQDVAITGTALMLTGNIKLQNAGRYLFAVPIMILGLLHFAHVDFVTAKVPAYFPAIAVWDYLAGLLLIAAAVGIISNRYLGAPGLLLAVFLTAFALLYHVPLMAANINSGLQWTGAMLDIAIAGGAFIVSAIAQPGHAFLKTTTR